MAIHLTITRSVRLPDPVRLARFARAPELGPRVLFFSGGSALNPLSRRLTEYTHNSIHLITPFDSGGSSAVLRKAFGMPAVGDLRNRMMALADQTVKGNPSIYTLFSHRLPKDQPQNALLSRLEEMIQGRDDLVAAIPDPMRKIIRNHLGYFRAEMPADFDLRGASLGNLVLVGGYLNNNRHLDPVLFLFSKLVEVRGTVRPIVNKDCHLAATLADGSRLVGQHLLTGKEVNPITSAVYELSLVDGLDNCGPAEVTIRHKVHGLIAEADLICYPIGSFYSSLMANLLPGGVANSIAENGCPKVFIPNTGRDPELVDTPVQETVKRLIDQLRRNAGGDIPVGNLLQFALVDSERAVYPGGLDKTAIEDLGVRVIDMDLTQKGVGTHLAPDKLLGALLSLA